MVDPAPYDCGPYFGQHECDFLTLEFIGLKYKARSECYELDPSVLAQTLVKYVHMLRLKPWKLEHDFFNQTNIQKMEIGETVSRIDATSWEISLHYSMFNTAIYLLQLCKLYWNGDPRFQEGFMEHLSRLEAKRNPKFQDPPSKDVQKLLLRKFTESKYRNYHFMLTKDRVKPLTAAVIRKVWG